MAAPACPVFGPGDGFMGALSLADPRDRFDQPAIDRMRDQRLAAAAELTAETGGSAEALLAIRRS